MLGQQQGPDSLEQFSFWLRRIPTEMQRSEQALSSGELSKAAQVVRQARRVFCVGSGSSVATAWHIAFELTAAGSFSAHFVGTSQLLSTGSIDANDVVILVSQGYNRADGRIVTAFARQRGALVVLLTAGDPADAADVVVRFTPTAEEERLFCRPCGAVTSFLAGAALVASVLNGHMPSCSELIPILQKSGERDVSSVVDSVAEASLIVILGSGHMAPACHNIALSLREGAAKLAEFFEIEYYAHGQYAPHFKHRETGGRVVYLLPYAQTDRVSVRAKERIVPLLNATGSTYHEIDLHGDLVAASMDGLVTGNVIVAQVIARSGYDMNSPMGKEENRGFQLVQTNYYER